MRLLMQVEPIYVPSAYTDYVECDTYADFATGQGTHT